MKPSARAVAASDKQRLRGALVVSLALHLAILFLAGLPQGAGRWALESAPSNAYRFWHRELPVISLDFRRADDSHSVAVSEQSDALASSGVLALTVQPNTLPVPASAYRAATPATSSAPASPTKGTSDGGSNCLVQGFRFCSSG